MYLPPRFTLSPSDYRPNFFTQKGDSKSFEYLAKVNQDSIGGIWISKERNVAQFGVKCVHMFYSMQDTKRTVCSTRIISIVISVQQKVENLKFFIKRLHAA